MKIKLIIKYILGHLLFFAAMASIPFSVSGEDLKGLWVGNLSINGVSQVNTSNPDLAFDLGIKGFKSTNTLINRKSSGWSFNNTENFVNKDWTIGNDGASTWTDNSSAPFYSFKKGTSLNGGEITAFFRKNFNISNPTSYKKLSLRIWVKGGIDLYLNGDSILREDITNISHDSPSSSDAEGIFFHEIEISASSLYTSSSNLISAGVHQDAGKSGVFFSAELVGINSSGTEIVLISKISDGWSYHFKTSAPASGWESVSYEESSWTANGVIPFYYKPSETALGKFKTTYFRKKINITDPSLVSALEVETWKDDGVIIYINGVEAYRYNLPHGNINSGSSALSELMPSDRYSKKGIDKKLLKQGENIIAAEVHFKDSDSNELSFDLKLSCGMEETLVSTEAPAWKYYPSASSETYTSPEPDYMSRKWKDHDYNDINWAAGKAKIGFGNGGEETLLGYTSDNWPMTWYFRHEFNSQVDGFDSIKIQLLRDDGAVVYINGTEVLRSNMPTGVIGYDTHPVSAIGTSREDLYIVKEINLSDFPGLLRDGNNTVAVEIHQHSSETGGSAVSNSVVTPAPSGFDMRVIFHEDSSGNTRLLKEVYQMHEKIGEELHPVLLSNDMLIPKYQGKGWRISAVGIDFKGTSLLFNGSFGESSTVSGRIELPENHSTNPFLHRYHPDHDNWDARYEKQYPDDPGAPEESFKVLRDMKFVFSKNYPPGCEGDKCSSYPPPGWGSSYLGGTYSEVIKGLHKDDITISGTFTFKRISTVSELKE